MATIDAPHAVASVGLLIVSGGNEVRIGAHRGMARLATAVAAQGYPVLRFDRRGIGDSNGCNRGYRSSGPEIEAAVATFRSATGVQRVVAFGNCDAATALVLCRDNAAIDALILSNPWVVESTDGLPPTAAVRAHYLGRLGSLTAWAKLLRGGVNLRGLLRGLRKSMTPETPQSLGSEFSEAMRTRPLPTTIIASRQDGTAQAFLSAWKTPLFMDLARRPEITVQQIATGSHSYAGPGDFERLLDIVVRVLASQP